MPSHMRIALFGVFVIACTTVMWFAGNWVAGICNRLAAAGNPFAVPLFVGSAFVGAVVCLAAVRVFVAAGVGIWEERAERVERVQHPLLGGHLPGNVFRAGEHWLAHVDDRFYRVPTYWAAVDIVSTQYSVWGEFEIVDGKLVSWGTRGVEVLDYR